MRKQALTIATAILALTVFAFGQAASAPGATTDPGEKKARALLAKMIQTMGGDAYLNYKTRSEEGRTYSFFKGEAKDAGALFWRFWQYPDKERIEFTKQRDVVYIYNGDKSYEVTYKGTAEGEAKPLAEYLRRRAHSLEMVLRQWLNQPGTLVMYSGTAIADRKLVEEVTIINAQNDSVTIGIDPNTNLPLRRTFTFRDEQGYKTDDEIIYANYRRVDGIMTPMSIVRLRDADMVAQQFLSDVHYNVAIPPEKFEAKITYDPSALPPKK